MPPILALLLVVLLWSAAAAQSDCLPGASADLLPAHLQISPAAEVVGSAPGVVIAYARAGQCRARLDLYSAPAAGEPLLLGSLAGDYGLPHHAGGYLYARAGTTGTLSIISLARVDRPALVALHEIAAGQLALAPGALFSANPAGLHAYSLAAPESPAPVALIPITGTQALHLFENRLLALAPDTLHILTISNPLAPQIESAIPLGTGLAPPYELHATGNFAYLMGRQVDVSACLIVRLAPSPQVTGTCPFIADKTTFLGNRAYVNPNPGASEYLDYKIVSLADPAAPSVVGSLPIRFAPAVSFGNFAYTTTHDQRLARLEQQPNGALNMTVLGWSATKAEMDGTHRLLHDGLLYVDRGVEPETENRLVRRLNLTALLPRVAPPDLLSNHLGGGRWFAGRRTLYTFAGPALMLFDPGAGVEVGRLPLPVGESAGEFVVGNNGIAWLTTQSNLFIAVDISNPTAPALVEALGLPGTTHALAAAGGALFAFDESVLRIFIPDSAGRLSAPKVIPIAGGVREIAATASALLVRRNDGLELLDVSRPLTPQPVAFDWGAGTVVRLLPAAGERVAVVARLTAAQAGGVATTYARIFELTGAAPRLLATIDVGGETNLHFDGTRLVDRNLVTWVWGHVTRGIQQTTIGESLSPAPGITYTVTGDVAAAGQSTLCLVHEADDLAGAGIDGGLPGRPAGAPAARSPLFRATVTECHTGEVVPSLTLRVELSLTSAGDTREVWTGAEPALDKGDHWETPGGIEEFAGGRRFVLSAGQAWALMGPPPPPLNLPIVRAPGNVQLSAE